jgi:2-polyprenyl-3-methyl-5-hydroxy-6-metoxy-1,4-benzoquinol methylase
LKWRFLKGYYPEEYTSYTLVESQGDNRVKRFIKQYGNWKKRRLVNKYIKKGRILEVGCGSGDFLDELLRSGVWDAVGIEPNENAAQYSEKRLGIPIYQEKFSEVEFENKSFDVLIMWYVLEHLEEPVKSMQKAYKLLHDGGWFVFSIPYLEGWEARVFGEYWSGWDLPRHLYIFPIKLIRQILSEIGFEIVAEKCISSGHAILGHSIDFWTQDWGGKYPQLKKWLMRIYLSPVGKLAFLIPLYISNRIVKSTTLTIVARKTGGQSGVV